MTRHRPRSRLLPRVTAALAATGLSAGAGAIDFVWDGDGVNNLFGTDGNWVGDVAPGFDLDGCNLIFGPADRFSAPNLLNDRYFDIGGISFTDAEDVFFLIGGTSARLSLVDGGAITNDSNLDHRFQVDVYGTGSSLIFDAQDADLRFDRFIDLSDTGGVELTVRGDNDIIITNVIRGDGGSLLKEGDGVLTLGANNSFDGGVTLNAGTIVLGNDGALGDGDLTLTGDGTIEAASFSIFDRRTIENDIDVDTFNLTIGGANDLVLDGIVSGTGGLRISLDDDARLFLNTDNTYTGLTNVVKGTLQLDGSVAGDLQIRNAGILTGDGRVKGDLNALSDSTFALSNGTIDNFRIDGNYDVRKDAVLTVDLNANNGNADELRIDGTANLRDGSIIQANILGNSFLANGQDFFIMEADGGITDGGVEIEISSATLTVDLIRDGDFNDADTRFGLEVSRAADAYSAPTDSRNNRVIGERLDQLITIASADPDGDLAELFGRLDAFGENAYNLVVAGLSPEPFYNTTAIATAASIDYHSQQAFYLANRRQTNDEPTEYRRIGPPPGSLAAAHTDPMLLAAAYSEIQEADDAEAEADITTYGDSGWTLYGNLMSLRTDGEDRDERVGFDANSFGGVVGADHDFGEQFIGGVALSYLYTDADWNGSRGGLEDNTLRVGPYLSLGGDTLFVDISLSFAYHDYDSEREVPGLARTAKASFNALEYTGYAGTGLRFKLNDYLFFTPLASIQYSYFDWDGFNEREGQGADLAVGSRDGDALVARAGASLAGVINLNQTTLRPAAYVGYQYDFSDDDDISAAFRSGGDPFVIRVTDRSEDSFFFGVGLDADIGYNVTLYGRVEASYGDATDTTGVAGGISIRF